MQSAALTRTQSTIPSSATVPPILRSDNHGTGRSASVKKDDKQVENTDVKTKKWVVLVNKDVWMVDVPDSETESSEQSITSKINDLLRSHNPDPETGLFPMPTREDVQFAQPYQRRFNLAANKIDRYNSHMGFVLRDRLAWLSGEV